MLITPGGQETGGSPVASVRTALNPGERKTANPAQESSWIVHARVLDSGGNPLRGASVELELEGDSMALGHSGRDGRVSLELTPDPLPFDSTRSAAGLLFSVASVTAQPEIGIGKCTQPAPKV